MVRDDTLAKIKDVDFNTILPTDVTYVDRLMQAAEKRWVKYAGPKPVIDEPIESTVKFDLNLRKFSYDGLAESLLIIYNSNSINNVRDGEINLPEIMKVGHSVKAIKDIVIEPVDNKSRKRKKGRAVDIDRDNKRRKKEDVLDMDSGFSLILPYILTQRIKNAYQDTAGSALNQSAISAENFLNESAQAAETRSIIVLRQQEPRLVMQFFNEIQKYRSFMDLSHELCVELIERRDLQWPSSLKKRFCILWKILSNENRTKMLELATFDNKMQEIARLLKTPDFDLLKTIEIFKGHLLLTEFEVDNEMIRRGLRLGPACLSPGADGADSLNDQTNAINQRLSEVLEKLIDFPKELLPLEIYTSYLRVMWLDAKLWVLRGNQHYMMKRLKIMAKVFANMKDKITDINLANVRESPIISEHEVLKRINMVERAGQREEVERLYANGEYRQVAELLWITLKAEPTAEDQTPMPQERANQLKLLLSSLHELEESDQPRSYAQGIERVLLEIAVCIRARHSLPDWVNGAGQILQLIVQKHHNSKLATLADKFTTAELGRLFRSLCSLCCSSSNETRS